MEPKKLPISDDMAEYFDAYQAAFELRASAIKLPFGYRKAFKASKDAVKYHKKFWKCVHDVYPETANGVYTYLRLEQVLIETIEDD